MTTMAEKGTDPAVTPEKTEEEAATSDEESGPTDEGVNPALQKVYDGKNEVKNAESERKTPEVPKGGWPGAGRPKEGIKYNTDEHPRGYDPIGKVAWNNARNNQKNESIVSSLKKHGLTPKINKKLKQSRTINEANMLDEGNILPDEQ